MLKRGQQADQQGKAAAVAAAALQHQLSQQPTVMQPRQTGQAASLSKLREGQNLAAAVAAARAAAVARATAAATVQRRSRMMLPCRSSAGNDAEEPS
jgi:hypothetical protein